MTEVVSRGCSSSSQAKNTSTEGGIHRGESCVCVCVSFCPIFEKKNSFSLDVRVKKGIPALPREHFCKMTGGQGPINK